MMKEIAKYLLAAAAACFVGLGSGLMSLYEPALEYDKEAYKLAFEVEQATGSPVRSDTDCFLLGDALADCKLAKHLLESVNAQTALFDQLWSYLLWGGMMLALIGLTLTGVSNLGPGQRRQPKA